jgi:hypothetical protein
MAVAYTNLIVIYFVYCKIWNCLDFYLIFVLFFTNAFFEFPWLVSEDTHFFGAVNFEMYGFYVALRHYSY